jgi:regulation of enolase protein 1 (concanavalin A-like superfamily)
MTDYIKRGVDMRRFIISILAFAVVAMPVMAEPVVGRLASLPQALTLENPGKAEVDGDHLILTAPKGSDMFTPSNGAKAVLNAPRITFPVSGDFIFSARVNAPFAADYDGAALVVWSDGAHWGKVLFERINAHESAITSSFVMPASDNSYHVRVPAEDAEVWLKIVRAGDMYLLYMSQDGKTWTILRDLGFQAQAAVSVGFLSQSPLGEQFTATFSHVRFETKTFKDYWQGE